MPDRQNGQPQSLSLGWRGKAMFDPSEPAASPIAGTKRLTLPARARTRGPTGPNEPPRRPVLPTRTGLMVNTRSVDGQGLLSSDHRHAAEHLPSSNGPKTHTTSGGKRPAGNFTQAGNQSHTHRPLRTLAAVRSPGTARIASRATAPSTRTAEEERDWAICGRHGQIRARMCGLPHLSHDAQIPYQRITLPAFRQRGAPAPGNSPAARAVPPIPMAPVA